MTQLEAFKLVIKDASFKENENLEYYKKAFSNEVTTVIDLYNYTPIFQVGYTNFCSTWLFNNEGKLLGIGHYEE